MHYPYQNKEEVLNSPLAKGYRLAQVMQRELVELRLLSKGEVLPHALPIHVTFYVVSGQGTLKVDDEFIMARQGDVLAVEPNHLRGWLNTGSDELVVLVIKDN